MTVITATVPTEVLYLLLPMFAIWKHPHRLNDDDVNVNVKEDKITVAATAVPEDDDKTEILAVTQGVTVCSYLDPKERNMMTRRGNWEKGGGK
mmetsp:Transcript_33384/g.47392  ORF Transcript_33384/g.47392 Transcript_33384/m.47392 type:complete len:93 (-) Transcript_33384:39-317(-)